MTTCTYHCAACGLHFHSLEAFDLHRVGDYAEGRRCEHPLDLLDDDGEMRLQALTEAGKCRLSDSPETLYGVTVWISRRQARTDGRPFSAASQAGA